MSFRVNFLKNGLATTIQKVIRVADQLLLVPFFISAWGAAYYGEWITLTIIPTIIGLSDLGFGTAAGNSFVLKYASNDEQKAMDIASSGFRATNIIVIACILLSIFSIFILDFFKLFDKSLIPRGDAILAISFLMISRVIGFYQPLYDSFFKAVRKASVSMHITSFFKALSLLSSVIILSLGGSIVIFALSNLLVSIIFILFFGYRARKILKLENHVKGRIKYSDMRKIFKKGFGFLLSPIWQSIFFQGSTLVVRIVLGPIAVTIFSTVRTAIRSINQANGIIISSVLPELQFEIGANDFNKARRIFRFSIVSVLLISFFGMVFLYFFGPWLYEIWTKKSLNPPATMWNIFILGIGFNAVWWMASDVLIASNHPYKFVIPAIIVSITSVLATYILSNIYGLNGVAMGSFILDFVLVFWIFPKSCKILKQPIKSFVVDTFNDLKTMKFK